MCTLDFVCVCTYLYGLPSWLSGKEFTCKAGATGDASSIPGWGSSPGGGNGNHRCILAWEIPWTEEPGRLQSVGLQRVRYDLVTKQQHYVYLDISY